jgi:hypothetical protein
LECSDSYKAWIDEDRTGAGSSFGEDNRGHRWTERRDMTGTVRAEPR